jgi:hypothetical protein
MFIDFRSEYHITIIEISFCMYFKIFSCVRTSVCVFNKIFRFRVTPALSEVKLKNISYCFSLGTSITGKIESAPSLYEGK